MVEVLLIFQISFLILLNLVLYYYPLIKLNYVHIILEKIILFLENIVLTNSSRFNQNYLPLIFILFFPLFLSNLAGMFPYNFTVTAHLFVTLFFSFFCFFGINWIALARHGKRYLNLF